MKKYTKYPRTYHLPYSNWYMNNDKTLKSDQHFKGKKIVATIKMDGENFTRYNDYCHARSLNSGTHLSRNKSKDILVSNSTFI